LLSSNFAYFIYIKIYLNISFVEKRYNLSFIKLILFKLILKNGLYKDWYSNFILFTYKEIQFQRLFTITAQNLKYQDFTYRKFTIKYAKNNISFAENEC